ARLAEMNDAELSELLTKLGDAFDDKYGDGTGLTDEALTELEALGNQIKTAQEVTETRETERQERDRRAAELRNSVRPAADADAQADADENAGDDEQPETSENVREPVAAASDAPLVAAMHAMS